MARVELRDATKVFPPDVCAVRHMTLQVEHGDFVVLVGPSGCGKSTALRLIAGLEELSEGQILIDGRDVNGVPPKDRDVAMVFQNYALYPHMTVRSNIAFGLKMRRVPRAEIRRRVHDAASMLGIEGLLDRRPRQLSGGELQRVAVGRAIVRNPKVFLFDEPLSNLDAALRVQMRGEIIALHRRLGATMIYVTHDQVEAMTMGSRIAVMRQGRLHQVATPMILYEEPTDLFVASFIGSPPMNFFRGRLVSQDGALAFEAQAMRVRISQREASRLETRVGRDVVLGLRPEAIEIGPRSQHDGVATVGSVVEMIEPTGAEVLVHLSVGKASYVARIRNRMDLHVGTQVEALWDLSRAHFFDPETEAAIR